MGSYYHIGEWGVLHEGRGRAYEDGSGSWVELGSDPTPEELAAHAAGYTLAGTVDPFGAPVPQGYDLEADGHVSVPVHASASGTVSEVGLWPHPSGGFKPAVQIQVDPYSAQAQRPRMIPRWEGLPAEALVAAVKEAGVVGLGGAAFPTHVKLVPPPGRSIGTLLINGCECEPYLTCDHRVMVEHADSVIAGLRHTLRWLDAKRGYIGVERVVSSEWVVECQRLHRL